MNPSYIRRPTGERRSQNNQRCPKLIEIFDFPKSDNPNPSLNVIWGIFLVPCPPAIFILKYKSKFKFTLQVPNASIWLHCRQHIDDRLSNHFCNDKIFRHSTQNENPFESPKKISWDSLYHYKIVIRIFNTALFVRMLRSAVYVQRA